MTEISGGDCSAPGDGGGVLPQKIGFVGSGQMALALAKGFMASGLVLPQQVRFMQILHLGKL